MHNKHQWPNSFGQEFHDLQELALNLDSKTLELNGSWGNLGCWLSIDEKPIHNYGDAACELANTLARFTQLNSSHRVLDVGFGCGDQLIHWQKSFGVNAIWGINYSQVQTEYAQQKLTTFDCTAHLIHGDAGNKEVWQALPNTFDRIVALDCVYHFSNKFEFLELCASHLMIKDEKKLNGVNELVLTDLVLNKPISHPVKRLILKIICYFSHIPFENFKVRSDYEVALKRTGLELTEYKDISAAVMLPFSQWVFRFRQEIMLQKKDKNHSKKIRTISWSKYIGTALFLRWAVRHDIFSYALMRMTNRRS